MAPHRETWNCNFVKGTVVIRAMVSRLFLLGIILSTATLGGCQKPVAGGTGDGAISKEGIDFIAHTMSEIAKRSQKLTSQEQARLAKSSNAADQYELAARTIDDPKRLLAKAYDSKVFPPQISAGAARVIKANASSIKLVQVGLKHRLNFSPPANLKSPESYWSVADHFPHLAQAKQLAKFICLAGDLAGSEGNRTAAVQDYALAFNMGSQFLNQGSTLIDFLVGIAIEAIARKHIESISPYLSSKDLRSAAHTLIQQSTVQLTVSDQVQSEIRNSPNYLPKDEDLRKLSADEKRQLAEIPALKKELAERMLKRKAVFSGPFAARGALPHAKNSSNHNPMAEVIFEMVPTFDEFWLSRLNSQTDARLLSIKLSAMAYQIDRHHLPTNLRELFARNPKMIPEDPFYPGQPMLTSFKNGSLTIYSRGPDGKDDGGKSIQYKGKSRALADSKGDIVVVLKAVRHAPKSQRD